VIIRNTRDLGGFLRQAREDANLTQAELAAQLGVRRQRVLYLERGEGQPQLAFVFSVLKALDLQLSLDQVAAAAPTITRPRSKAMDAALPYSIDDIADGGIE
jgi:transcriptional regulator with XRE-family HTH domain